MLLLQALLSLLGRLRIKAGAHSRFSHQTFIIKKGSRASQPLHLQPSPRGSEPGPVLARSAMGEPGQPKGCLSQEQNG